MYLRQLYRNSKFWFIVVLLFIGCQLFINLKRGMVVSPFYHYGMYSGVMKPADQYPAFEIITDGSLLKTADFTPQQWDKIMQPLHYYTRHKQWNGQMFLEVNRITGITDTSKYVTNLQKKEFFDWYKRYLSHSLDREVRSLVVQQKTYSPGR